MNRLFLILFFVSTSIIFSDSYDEALKYEALGDYDSFDVEIRRYFEENINDINQDSIIEQLLYSATLFNSLDQTLNFLTTYVKFMENKESRFRIYKKIAQIYELTGQIQSAGIYYEKAAYISPGYIDLSSLLNSIDMLILLGYHSESLSKLLDLEKSIPSELNNRYNSMLSHLYRLTGEIELAKYYLLKVDKSYFNYDFLKYELFNNPIPDSNSLNYLVSKNSYMLLKDPNSYIGIDSELRQIPHLPNKESSDFEINVGQFQNKLEAAGIINIVEQMKLDWFFDKVGNVFDLYIFTKNRDKTIEELKQIGLYIKE